MRSIVAAVFFVAATASAQVRDMQLISSGMGWALAGNRLLWTSDNGQNWSDITPARDQYRVGKVFFLNSQSGWAVLRASSESSRQLLIALTSNAGKSWQYTPLELGSSELAGQLARPASVFFLDAREGWLVLRLGSSSNFSRGRVFHTEDGGLTWSESGAPPVAGDIRFITPQKGWLAGGPANDQLWLTQDEGQTWQRVQVAMPNGCDNSQVAYGMPSFVDRQHGNLTVKSQSPNGNCTIDYASVNGGQTWQARWTGRDVGAFHGAIAHRGAQTLHVYASSGVLHLMESGEDHEATLPLIGSVSRAEFVGDTSGWLIETSGECTRKTQCQTRSELLATSDGGKSYTIVSPRVNAGTQSLLLSGRQAASGLLSTAASPLVSNPFEAMVSEGAGFDAACAPGETDLQAWWAASPYQDTGVYLGGCNVYCASPNGQNSCAVDWHSSPSKTVDTNLSPTWVTDVTAMGWGLIPIWVGPQAPCISDSSDYWLIDAGTAAADGASQADEAIQQAAWLEISAGIIYYDMEGYTPDHGSCSGAVEAFLGGWTTELHAQGFSSGLYGSLVDYESDYLALSPLPDAAWIAAWNTNNTVWNLGTLSNTYWANNQRIHQWSSEDEGETWGGVTISSLDLDAMDAPVVESGTASAAGFQLTNSGAITIATADGSGSSTISITPSGGFTGDVGFSCSVAVVTGSSTAAPTCSVPALATISGSGASTVTLTVKTTANSAAVEPMRTHPGVVFLGPILTCLLLGGFLLRRRRVSSLLLLLVVVVATGGACGGSGGGGSSGGNGGGGGGGTAAGSYTVIVIGIDKATGTIKSSTAVSLVVD